MNKQIEEMQSTLHQGLKPLKETYGTDEICSILYNAGYRKQSEVAREIFAEIDKVLDKQIRKCEVFHESEKDLYQRTYFEGGEWSARQIKGLIRELKKKYGVEKDG